LKLNSGSSRIKEGRDSRAFVSLRVYSWWDRAIVAFVSCLCNRACFKFVFCMIRLIRLVRFVQDKSDASSLLIRFNFKSSARLELD
jgi:hypothetical protein